MARLPLKTDTIMATPPVAVVAASVAGIPLQDWVYILTITYTVFLIGEKLFRWFRAWQERKTFRAAMELPPEGEDG